MSFKFLGLSLLLVASNVWALTTAPADLSAKSAHRAPGVSYRAYQARANLLSQRGQKPNYRTPVEESVAFGKAQLPAATAWENEQVMQERFQNFRDLRFLNDSAHPGFLRRSSWLYPDDGCFARASLAIRNLSQARVDVPSKIFVFGDLSVNTVNSPSGEVTWWYHVAPLVEVNGQKYVLDPAIEPKQPLKLADWLARMSRTPQNLEVAVCGSGSYTPYDPCHRATDGVENAALNDQAFFLDAEWDRLEELHRQPLQELGDLPPWL